MKNALAGAITATIMLLLSSTLFNLSEYHVGIMAAMTMMCWVWVLVAAFQAAAERGPRRTWGLDPEDDDAQRPPLPARVVRIERVQHYALPPANPAAPAAIARRNSPPPVREIDGKLVAQPRRDPRTVREALACVPGAIVYPPRPGDGDWDEGEDENAGILVASTNQWLIAAVYAALSTLRDVPVILVAGVAPPPPEQSPGSSLRWLWSQHLIAGQPWGPEPKRRQDARYILGSCSSYWTVVPVSDPLALEMEWFAGWPVDADHALAAYRLGLTGDNRT